MKTKPLKILVGCEESQIVCKAFRKLGHEAYSNDLLPCSGRKPQWHLQMDIFKAAKLTEWDVLIAFPPCTHLAVSGAAWFAEKRKDGRQKAGIQFFMKVAKLPIKHKAIENPVSIMSTVWRKPDQIVQPYWFGDTERKATCLWLENLPLLVPTNMVKPKIILGGDGKTYSKSYYDSYGLKPIERSKVRSKTFQGIADAMAAQWSQYLETNTKK